MTVTDTTMDSPLDRSPPTTPTPRGAQARPRPRARSVTQDTGVSPGSTRPTTRATGTAPMAATSARFWAAARRPTCWALIQPVRKWRPSTSTSVLTQ